jgi:hypothetical protein
MKTKNIAVGFMIIGFVIVLKLVIILVASTPAGSKQQSQICQFDPSYCAVPQNLSDYHMFPR